MASVLRDYSSHDQDDDLVSGLSPKESLAASRGVTPTLPVVRCVGQDSNLGTPSGRDLESLAFDRAWLPTRGRAPTAVRKTFRVSVARKTHHPSLFPSGRLPGREGGVHGAILH